MFESNEDEIQIMIGEIPWRFFRGASGAWICVCDDFGLSCEGDTIVEAVENAADCVYLRLMEDLEQRGIVEDEEEVAYEDTNVEYGVDDEQLDIEEAAEVSAATAALQANGVAVESETRPGLGHGIDNRGIELGLAVLTRHLE